MRIVVLAVLVSLTGAAIAAGDGLVAAPQALGNGSALGGSHWQARFELDSPVVPAYWARQMLGQSGSVLTARLLGDYHLDALQLGQAGAMRLTGGVLLSQRPTPIGAASRSELGGTTQPTRSIWPYFGIGYSGAGVRGDWGFSADVGLAAQDPGEALRLGQVLDGGLGVGNALRSLRLQPVVRLGVNYSF